MASHIPEERTFLWCRSSSAVYGCPGLPPWVIPKPLVVLEVVPDIGWAFFVTFVHLWPSPNVTASSLLSLHWENAPGIFLPWNGPCTFLHFFPFALMMSFIQKVKLKSASCSPLLTLIHTSVSPSGETHPIVSIHGAFDTPVRQTLSG